MISKCANPDCSAPFQYLRGGKVIRLDVGDPVFSARVGKGAQSHRRARFFWLCQRCSAKVTVKLLNGCVSIEPFDNREAQTSVA